MNAHTHLLILAGGVGSRFWPASREDNPKQFLDILGTGKSLLRLTYERFAGRLPADRIWVITHEKYMDQVREHLPELPSDHILGEPSRNNTAPSIAWASMKLAKIDRDAVCVVVPSDHVILKEEAFHEKIERAVSFASARRGSLLTLGISPTRPDTGYGYIEYDRDNPLDGVCKVRTFREKPDLNTAETYLESGNYVWNSGMFVWSVQAILEAFRKHAAQIYETLHAGYDKLNTAAEQAFIQENYPKTEKISIDYAILERSEQVYTIPADIGWSDLGTWASLYAYLKNTPGENIVLGAALEGDQTSSCIVRANDGKLVVIKGLEDYIVVDTEDALLIYPMRDEQEIKAVLKKIDKKYL
jgi:mannose-1-phosphate guanylyltransferase